MSFLYICFIINAIYHFKCYNSKQFLFVFNRFIVIYLANLPIFFNIVSIYVMIKHLTNCIFCIFKKVRLWAPMTNSLRRIDTSGVLHCKLKHHLRCCLLVLFYFWGFVWVYCCVLLIDADKAKWSGHGSD